MDLAPGGFAKTSSLLQGEKMASEWSGMFGGAEWKEDQSTRPGSDTPGKLQQTL